MIFSMIVALLLISSIDRIGAISTVHLTNGNDAETTMENLLIEFMTDLKKLKLNKLNFNQLIVIGKTEILLQSTKDLLKNTPYLIGTAAEAIICQSHYGSSFVLFFIDGLSSSEVDATLSKLPNDYLCSILLISLEKNMTNEAIATTIASAAKMKLRNVSFALFDGRVIKIYTQEMNANCHRIISLINEWIPKKGFTKRQSAPFIIGYERGRKFDMHGCPMIVSTLELPPTMVLQEDENKSVKIRGGIEGHLVNAIAKYLNAVPVVKIASAEETWWVAPNGTKFGIVADVARGKANFGIGRIRPTSERAKFVDFTASYNHECMIWTVPLSTTYSYSVLISEFSPNTWILVILSLFLWCVLAFAIPKLNRGLNHNREPSLNIFDLLAVSLAYGIPRRSLSHSMLGKLFFILFLHYSRVISTAYTTSLASILTTALPQSTIVDEEGIIASGLRTAGTQSARDLLADQIPPNSSRIELINRYEVIKSTRAALTRIADRRDIAYLRHSSTILDAVNVIRIAGDRIEFYPVPNCVISYHSVMVIPKGSYLTTPISTTILQLRAAGIFKHWTNIDHSFKSRFIKPEVTGNNLSSLESIFFFYLCCLIPAFLAFIAELIVFKLNIRYFTR